MHYDCIGQTEHTCWTVGTRDSDCPGHGLCCFDGCANTCLDKQELRNDPCNPSPCGPGTTCTTNKHNNPICKCLSGLVPKPDTIKGCGPECITDADCKYNYNCENQRCKEKKDPCNPSPCGPGTTCKPNSLGNPVCECKDGLIPKPDAITGCGPECTIDSDCKSGYECSFSKCRKIVDPCKPSPCGPGTACTVNNKGNPVCQCLPGLIPKPDTIIGCGFECERDLECENGYVCSEHRCIEKSDPCDPSPCGPGTECMENDRGYPVCRCLPGLIPKPDTITGCGPECTVDTDCEASHICKESRCMKRPNPCDPNPCGAGGLCDPVGHTGFRCSCPPGYFGDADIQCIKKDCDIDEECSLDQFCNVGNFTCTNPCTMMQSCGDSQFCRVVNHQPICGFNEVIQKPVQRSKPFVIGSRHNFISNLLPKTRSKSPLVIGGAHKSPFKQPLSLSKMKVFVGVNEDDDDLGSHKGLQTATVRRRPVIGGKYRRRKRLLKFKQN
ncbi:zonadhesin [Lepeophtheirus salmonis]|uniref:zonadhesin n=1 Tax=Lepeophtheirus salmonis TaxID=72036 RepID=UPI001AE3D34B|nr:neurogenic locus notch homolog protein 1-like [Lepeophtheirus salmonis]